ncbi:MAG TPA: VWA domain-containing protein [Candidatus Nitrosotenuis sp.]|jgi:uncharacterized protein with von Willebrand factor type A (vWA) domain|nr:VWA domain-containing protein [Candidatus Nitrosotenuis sp.]HII03896.1 VWA domain-containing protein [Candidatus Nitrosotenuis sp.]
MSQYNLKSFVYRIITEENNETQKSQSLDQETIDRMLQVLANQSMRDKVPILEELESILQQNIKSGTTEQKPSESSPTISDSKPITKFLLEHGYLREEKNWLTKKGFFATGNQILKDLMAELKTGNFGLHETKSIGSGNTILDTTKKFEFGDELKLLNVSSSILNSIQRIIKSQKQIIFPLELDVDDFEEFETTEDVRASIVYCIDLSSTMKSSLTSSGMSRIEAAKRALWSLYVLNNRFFPNDSIKIIGFASMASEIFPLDIPFLKTYDANDDFLHYTNYQAAFRLARKLLRKTDAKNKRIVLITDGQPSACFVDTDSQKNAILSEKPYSNFYVPDDQLLSKIRSERNLKIDSVSGTQVYLCYRYKKVEPKVDERTMIEAKKCIDDDIQIDSIVVSEETELLDYVKHMEKSLKGKTYQIDQNNMDKVLVIDYLYNTKKILGSKN